MNDDRMITRKKQKIKFEMRETKLAKRLVGQSVTEGRRSLNKQEGKGEFSELHVL